MFVIDFSPHLGKKKKYPVRNLRLSADAGTLAATFGEEGRAEHAVWWSLAEGKPIGARRVDPFDPLSAEPVFSDDLSFCFFDSGSCNGAGVDFIGVVSPTQIPDISGDYYDNLLDGFDPSDDPDAENAAVEPTALVISPGNRWLVSAHDGGPCGFPGICVQGIPKRIPSDKRSTRKGRRFGEVDIPTALGVSADGTMIACGFLSRQVRLFGLRNLKDTAVIHLPDPPRDRSCVHGLAFSPSGKLLAVRTGSWDKHPVPTVKLPARRRAGQIAVFDLDAQSVVAQLAPTKQTGMAFTSDGKRLLTGGMDKLVRVWDTATWKEVARYDWTIGSIHSVAVSPDGTIAAAGGDKNRVVVWDLDGNPSAF